MWCVQCNQPGHTKQICGSGQNRDQRVAGGPSPPTHGGQGKTFYGQGNLRGPPRGQGGYIGAIKEFHFLWEVAFSGTMLVKRAGL